MKAHLHIIDGESERLPHLDGIAVFLLFVLFCFVLIQLDELSHPGAVKERPYSY